jgi:hypothetical protein
MVAVCPGIDKVSHAFLLKAPSFYSNLPPLAGKLRTGSLFEKPQEYIPAEEKGSQKSSHPRISKELGQNMRVGGSSTKQHPS